MMKKSRLEQQMTIFLGYAKKNGATEEEIAIIVKTIELIIKYLPFYKTELQKW